MPGEVCVVGAGVVGITSAWFLAEAGWSVTLLDRSGVAQGTSLRNGGQLSYRYVSPLADAGVPVKALQWLLERDGPLRWKPQADGAQWRWLAQFVARCRGSVNRRTTQRLARLGEHSRACLHALMAQQQLPPFAWQQPGKLVVYRTPALLARASAGLPAGPAPDDAVQQRWDVAQCLAHEPVLQGLAGRLAGGIFSRDEAVADCHAFCFALMQRLRAHPRFRGLVCDRALGFEPGAGAARLQLRCEAGVLGADAFVLAAGIASRHLAASAGLRLPLYPLKGYSLDAPIGAGHVPPRASITDFERKLLYARIGERLRIAAMVDLVGEDERIDPARLASLLRIARADLPAAGDYDQAQPWAGLRPATPGGAPIVGASPVPGLWLNVGHGALGFTFACGTASLLAEAMAGRPTTLPLDGLAWGADT
ncbi:D-amino acid dehydrogenase [Aquabacterium sp. OR-4]|uniref:D-amino acid dehydrogenase n=1 Tax=Aquabacterium sp. OR-4 TaxID=2978127 RepID=UPI0021B1FD3F|nr:D-amino acid dehydrogenase [Aquabacterium sp. OR-4]MDT7836878.1 D-amino acid dehydrogenase [Aquabacterium sp. OR-4]